MLRYIFAITISISLFACKTTNTQPKGKPSSTQPILINSLAQPEYKASREIKNELIHTRLDVSFDWNKNQLNGMATITLKPKFYPMRSLELDARSMDIKKVWLVKGDEITAIPYFHLDELVTIDLGREYTRNETYTVKLDYISKPDELKTKSGSAITSDKGLYFINSDGKDPYKPKQIWTQGQPSSSSVWFPTIDASNQRMTQEINITIDTSYVTLSNGVLQYSTMNPDGTRTDIWKQSKPHPPYLAMMAIGKYAIVKDKWRNMDLAYYVEPDYAPYAKEIYKNTPEMLEFFSKKLGVDYPWEKLDQVYVRDYVSGAMENTGAIVYGEFVQKNSRELLDGTAEDYVAHEIMHQWFGDYVTCESWANTTLNEAFATYGEYLWFDHKYGKAEADFHFNKDLNTYLREANSKQEKLIRYDHEDTDDMFDAHSYQKGARVLHMLRRVVGDDAFFTSIQDYLQSNKFNSAELAHLRLSFEKITGKDLNWFFDQWFLSPGHPYLDISTAYDSTSSKVTVNIIQKQDTERFPVFRFPLAIDIYNGVTVQRKEVEIRNVNSSFSFDSKTKPDLVNVDAEKYMLCAKVDRKTNAEWIHMFKNAPLFVDRNEALTALSANYKAGTPESDIVREALNDSDHNIRLSAIKAITTLAEKEDADTRKHLIHISLNDKRSLIRAAAIKALSTCYKGSDLQTLYKESLQDSSYKVIAAGLNAFVKADKKEGLSKVAYFEKEKSASLKISIAGIYADHGSDENYDFFRSNLAKLNGYEKYYFVNHFAKFILMCNESNMTDAIKRFEDTGRNDSEWLVRMAAVQAMIKLSESLDKREKDLTKQLASDNTGALRVELESIRRVKDFAIERAEAVKKAEKNEELKKIYGVID